MLWENPSNVAMGTRASQRGMKLPLVGIPTNCDGSQKQRPRQTPCPPAPAVSQTKTPTERQAILLWFRDMLEPASTFYLPQPVSLCPILSCIPNGLQFHVASPCLILYSICAIPMMGTVMGWPLPVCSRTGFAGRMGNVGKHDGKWRVL